MTANNGNGHLKSCFPTRDPVGAPWDRTGRICNPEAGSSAAQPRRSDPKDVAHVWYWIANHAPCANLEVDGHFYL